MCIRISKAPHVGLLDYLGHIRHAAVAESDSVFVEDLVEFMLTGKMFSNQTYEQTTNVRLYTLTKWWVEPNYSSITLLFLI